MTDDDYRSMLEVDDRDIEFLEEMYTLGLYTDNMKNAIQTLYDLKGF
jgi:hypothetical protein